MPINNLALYDSALSAIAACNSAWITSPSPASYIGQVSIAQALANEIDVYIPTIITGVTISQRQLLESIVKSVMINRESVSISPSDYVSIAGAVAALFTANLRLLDVELLNNK